MSVVSPDARKLADQIASAISDAATLANVEGESLLYSRLFQADRNLLALLSALDALEQGGKAGEANAGSTAEPCSVVKPSLADYADRIYDVLVATCGATDDESNRLQFRVFCLRPGLGEFRFCGVLGFGGKFWVSASRWYVTCYVEDETPERLAMIHRANSMLDTLHDAFNTSDSEAVAPKASNASAPPPSVEALEAERDKYLSAMTGLAYWLTKAEVGREQANKERDRLAAVLRRIEWCWDEGEGDNVCPACGLTEKRGHDYSCDIPSALAGVPGQEETT